LHLHHLRIRGHKKSIREFLKNHTQTPNNSEENQFSICLTEEEIKQRQLIEQNIFSTLEAYCNKPCLWQLTHLPRLNRHLLDKTREIANLYSLPFDFVQESVNQLFSDVDKNISDIRKVIQATGHISKEPNILFQKVRISDNQWRSLQLGRAREIFPDINPDEFTDDEFLQKYYNHVIQTLTPKADLSSANYIVQNREQPLDLNRAYKQAENKAKSTLKHMLKSYHERSTPDLSIIKEMVNLGKNKDQKS